MSNEYDIDESILYKKLMIKCQKIVKCVKNMFNLIPSYLSMYIIL